MRPVDEIRRDNLRALISRHGGQRAFGDAAGIKSPAQISQWVNGSKNSATGKPRVMSGATARAIETSLGLSLGWLDTEHDSDQVKAPPVPSPETTPGYVRFELFEGGAGMGAGLVNQDFPEVVKTIELAEWEVRRKLGYLPRPGRIQLITGRGPSMRPKLEDGDIVWIDTSCDYFDGDDYYLINIGGETQIKMLQKRGDGLYVVSVNSDFPAYRPDPGDVTVLGKALLHAGVRKF
ncbi:S24 family peptidase [Stenotrophomonas sp. RAC2]|uniref:S24 family peptidase n=1 Tax=Stenotrophomonas sp. RAC2 TaxID=3064902 RepID=UPI002721BA2F|nr:S24 family peptidase [Stenotrophomonas sp. RAC2]MDV9040993.1 S24 family peptidase [Stenotrophomonas sp. RAC2]